MADLLLLLPFVLVPAAALVFVRPAGRRILGAIGLGFGLFTGLLVGGGPDNFGTVFPFLGFCLTGAALLGEAIAFLAGLLRRAASDEPPRRT